MDSLSFGSTGIGEKPTGKLGFYKDALHQQIARTHFENGNPVKVVLTWVKVGEISEEDMK